MSERVFDTVEKKLLVLGGTSSREIVEQAKRMGVYCIVADIEETDPGKEIADEAIYMSTTDFEGISRLIAEKHIDGVFCGPSEFNLQNVMKVCEQNGLPFYATQKQWNICQNKASFKELCRKFDVPCVPEYKLTEAFLEADLEQIRYPVIVKPVDAGSSRGISVCWNEAELREAVPKAIAVSKEKKFLVEKYIRCDYGFGSRYIANDGEIYLSAVCDRYTVDEPGGKALISSGAVFPSKKIDEYIEKINPQVIAMFKSIGIRNGTFFMQALFDEEDNQIYFHEMGLRLSSGLIFSMLEASCGYNDVQMMIRYALGGPMVTEEELPKIDPYMHGHFIGSLTIPLKSGVVGKIEGMSALRADARVLDCAQYYRTGDVVKPESIGTLAQHFCRVKMMTNSVEEYKSMVEWVQSVVKVFNADGENMIYRSFDVNRMR